MTTRRVAALLAAASAAMMITGCSSSDQSMAPQPPPQPSASELLQKQLADCHSENAGLKAQEAKLQQDAKASAARATDLESQLAELKAKTPAPRPAPAMRDSRAGYENALTLFRTRNDADAA